MQWWFQLVEKTAEQYFYAYSRECKDLDGRICYNIATGEAEITKASASDANNARSLEASIRHFYGKVVNEGFPDERHVCCG